MKDHTGHINLLQLTKDDEMRAVIEGGFEFTIVPWYAEVLFPELPTRVQAALNAEHTSYSMASELQVAAGIAACAEMAGETPNWDTVSKKIQAAMPPCKDYIPVLVDFVKHFSGVVGPPPWSSFLMLGERLTDPTKSWAKSFSTRWSMHNSLPATRGFLW